VAGFSPPVDNRKIGSLTKLNNFDRL
jgi:hypothetical protein